MRNVRKKITLKDEIIIAISSTSKRSYIWDPFFIMLRRYWKDCEHKIYFISDGECKYLEKKYDITVFEIKRDIGFLDGYRFICEKVSAKYMVVMQEDFIIEKDVDNDKLNKCKEIMDRDESLGFIRFAPNDNQNYETKIFDNGIRLVEINKEDNFSFSYQASLWNSNFFQQITSTCISHSDPWFSENFIDKKMNEYDGKYHFLGFNKLQGSLIQILNYKSTAVTEGKLTERSRELFERENIVLSDISEFHYHKIIIN